MKIIFVDWHDTLCTSKYWETLMRDNHDFKTIVHDFFSSQKEMIDDWMRGKYTSEQINKIISQKSGIDEKLLWNEFVNSCKNMKAHEPSIKLIQSLRKKYPVVLVTGNMDCFNRFTIPSLNLQDKFDMIINSYDVGYLKHDNNGKTFTDCAKKFNVKKFSNTYLIDDSPKVCKTFNDLGGTVLKVNNFDDTLDYLHSLINS